LTRNAHSLRGEWALRTSLGVHFKFPSGIAFPPAAEHLGDVGSWAEGEESTQWGAMKNRELFCRHTR